MLLHKDAFSQGIPLLFGLEKKKHINISACIAFASNLENNIHLNFT